VTPQAEMNGQAMGGQSVELADASGRTALVVAVVSAMGRVRCFYGLTAALKCVAVDQLYLHRATMALFQEYTAASPQHD